MRSGRHAPPVRFGVTDDSDDASGFDEARLDALTRTIREWSPLADVAAAVATASRHERTVYVERKGDRWRWSLAHEGGPYPLLRVTARYLGLDYQSLLVRARAVRGGWSVLDIGAAERTRPDAWRMVALPDSVSADEATALIEAAFVPRRRGAH